VRYAKPILLLALVTLCASVASAVRVSAVEDGMTFVTEDGSRVVLLGVTAPAIYNAGGDISRDVLEKLVLGRDVRLESDGVDTTDQGWLSRYVFAGDTFVNAMMIRKGFAALDLPDREFKHGDSLHSLEQTSARIEKGLWPFGVFEVPEFTVPEGFLTDTSGTDPWIETVSWDKANEYYGRLVRVVGTVAATYKSDKVFIMNFHQDYRRHFKVAVFSGDLHKFPPFPEDFYKKRVVRVTGLVKEYEGAAEMIVNHPDQIEILQ
jgi:endonuclease YncB( thermonuclease family)